MDEWFSLTASTCHEGKPFNHSSIHPFNHLTVQPYKMAHPKSRSSKRRSRARRTHVKITAPNVSKCSVTGEAHMFHRAYHDDEGNLRYRGKILVKAAEELD